MARAAFIPFAIFSMLAFSVQAQTPKFKAQSSAVVVDVIVTDSKGNVIPGLTAADFKVFENDVAQKIIGLESPDLLPAAARAGEPGNAPADAKAPPASGTPALAPKVRFVTLVMDIGDMRAPSLEATVNAAKEYVEKVLGPGDFAGVYSIGSKLRMVVPFTRDKAKLTEGIQSLNQHPNDGAYSEKQRDRERDEANNLRTEEDSLRASGSPELAEMVRTERLVLQNASLFQTTFQARAVFIALRSIAQSAANLPGRKNVILFSEGFAHSPEAGAELSAVVNSANRANVAVYVVDPGGLNGVQTGSGVKAESAGSRARGRTGGRQIYNDSDAQQMAELSSQKSRVDGGYSMFDLIQRLGADNSNDLETVAESTGGFLIKDRNSLLNSLGRIDRDSREYYTLTYQTQNQDYDGAFRRIKVTLANTAYKLRYRKGYWAIAPGEEMTLTPAAAQLLAAASSGGLKATLAARMNASLQLGSPDRFAVPVSVWVKGDSSALVKAPDGFTSGITMVVEARNAQGELVDVAQKTMHLHLSKDGVKEFERSGLRLTAMLQAPGLESLNTQAVVQFSNGVAAAGKFGLNIPARETAGASTKDTAGARSTALLLTQRVDAANAEQAPDALRVGEYQLVLPTQNVFTAADKLTVYFGLDDVTLDHVSGNPNLKLDLVLKSGEEVLRVLPTDTLYPFSDSKTRVFFLGQFGLNGLMPGPYTIEATVEDKARKTRAVQTAAFSIQ